jgi:hypothetical protein
VIWRAGEIMLVELKRRSMLLICGERQSYPVFLDKDNLASLSRLVWRPVKLIEAGLVILAGGSPAVPGLSGSKRSRRRRVSSFKRRSWGPEVQGSTGAPLRCPWARQKAYWRVYV